MRFSFEHPQYAWFYLLIPFLVLLYTAYLFWKSKLRRRIGDPQLIQALHPAYAPKKAHLKFILLLIAITAGVTALLNPRVAAKGESFTRNGIDVVFALDVSKSMLATDIPPSRLDRARQFVNSLLAKMENDRVAIVLFAGQSYTQMPLSPDLGAASLYIGAAGPDMIPQQGTVISEALNRSATLFQPNDTRFKSVILISDGEDHDAGARQTAEALAKQGVMVNTIGIGSPEGTTIPDPATGLYKTDENGQPVISKLNEEELQEIATATRGVYLHLTNTGEAVDKITQQLATIDRKAYGDESLMQFSGYYPWLAILLLLGIVGELFISEIKKVKA